MLSVLKALWGYRPGLEEDKTMQPVEWALDVALIVMKNGGSTAMADRTFENILKGFKTGRGPRRMAAGFRGGGGVGEGSRRRSFGRSARSASTCFAPPKRWSLASGWHEARSIPPPLPAEVERIKALAPPYNRWAMMAAAACTAAAFSQIPAGTGGHSALPLWRRASGSFVRSLLQASEARGRSCDADLWGAFGVHRGVGLRLGLSQTAPAALIASVVYMVPGMPLINGFMDIVIQHRLLVGLERIANAAFLFLVLTIAIAFAQAVVM